MRQATVQLDSARHVFTGFPNQTDASWGVVWAGGVLPNDMAGAVPCRLLHGLDYSSPWHSVLGIHANKGIAFDLEAIRQANPRCKIQQLSSTAGSPIPQSAPDNPGAIPSKCDIWVFVDGQPRFRREGVTYNDGELNIVVPLNDQDRFLTLVSTDGGDGIGNDAVIFGDPKLILVEHSDQ